MFQQMPKLKGMMEEFEKGSESLRREEALLKEMV